MDRAVRASLLWGVIGGLLFGVLSHAYRLATETPIDLPVVLALMVGVGVVTAALSHLVDALL